MASYITKPTTSYVRFVRGQKSYFDNITRDNDTLYFIYDNEESLIGELYLGNKKIGNGSITSLTDIINQETNDGDLLIYDSVQEEWISSSVDEAIRLMTGATNVLDGQSGLVPTPKAGDEDKFLKGDGTWSAVPAQTLAAVDNISIELNSNNEIGLKGIESAPVGSLIQKTASGLSWVSIETGINYEKVNNLNEVTENSTIYFVPNNTNTYDEYMLLDGQPELIGNTGNINLNNYVTTTTFNTTVGTLATKGEFNNLSDTVDALNERLTWQEIIEE